jgi:hypothetical protein
LFQRANRIWLACAASLAVAGASACAKDEPAGIKVELLAPANPAQRPEVVRFFWMGPGGVLVNDRLPQDGTLPATGDVLTSVFFATDQALDEQRALVVVGERGEAIVAGAAMRIEPNGEARRTLQLPMAAPLPDSDGDRIPDVVERNCLLMGAAMSCPLPPDAGPPDPPRDAGGDGEPTEAGATPASDGAADGPLGDDRPDAPLIPPDAADAAGDLPPDAIGTANPALAVGLVAHWRFDETAGSAIRDSSGNGNMGMLLGTTRFTPGHIRGALDIPAADGSGVTVPPTASVETIGGGFTIAAWTFRTVNRASGLSNVLSRRAAGTTNNEYFALTFNTAGQLRGFINTQLSPDPPSVTGALVVPLGQWVHVAYTFDGTVQRTYVNGVVTGTANYTGMVASGSMPLCIGCGNNRDPVSATDETLGGMLDELVLYNRALPAAEIQALAAGDLPPNP